MNNKQEVSVEQILENFEIEELEGRMEFMTWSCGVECGSEGCSAGCRFS